jgi:hypothetical protein
VTERAKVTRRRSTFGTWPTSASEEDT